MAQTLSAGLVKATNLTVSGTQSGAVHATNLNVGGAFDVGGDLTVGNNVVAGAFDGSGNLITNISLDVSGNMDVTGTLILTGAGAIGNPVLPLIHEALGVPVGDQVNVNAQLLYLGSNILAIRTETYIYQNFANLINQHTEDSSLNIFNIAGIGASRPSLTIFYPRKFADSSFNDSNMFAVTGDYCPDCAQFRWSLLLAFYRLYKSAGYNTTKIQTLFELENTTANDNYYGTGSPAGLIRSFRTSNIFNNPFEGIFYDASGNPVEDNSGNVMNPFIDIPVYDAYVNNCCVVVDTSLCCILTTAEQTQIYNACCTSATPNSPYYDYRQVLNPPLGSIPFMSFGGTYRLPFDASGHSGKAMFTDTSGDYPIEGMTRYEIFSALADPTNPISTIFCACSNYMLAAIGQLPYFKQNHLNVFDAPGVQAATAVITNPANFVRGIN